MCGIYLGLHDKAIPSDLYEKIKNRGPDSTRNLRLNFNGQNIQLVSSVLHIRGRSLCEQPFQNDTSVLQWNGEIFSGLEVKIFYLLNFYIKTSRLAKISAILSSCLTK